MVATFPRVILSPLQLAVGVTLHCKFRSKELDDVCHSLGICCSCYEVRLYAASAASNERGIGMTLEAFLQWVLDNADWNLRTLDGQGTFHSLRAIEIVTSGSEIISRLALQRLKELPAVNSLVDNGKILVQKYCKNPKVGFSGYKWASPSGVLNLKFSLTTKTRCFLHVFEVYKYKFSQGLEWLCRKVDLPYR